MLTSCSRYQYSDGLPGSIDNYESPRDTFVGALNVYFPNPTQGVCKRELVMRNDLLDSVRPIGLLVDLEPPACP